MYKVNGVASSFLKLIFGRRSSTSRAIIILNENKNSSYYCQQIQLIISRMRQRVSSSRFLTPSKIKSRLDTWKWRALFGGLSVGLLSVPFWKITVSAEGPTEIRQNQEKRSEEAKHYAIIKKADELYNNYLVDHVYNGLIRFANSEYPELLWRLARATCERAKITRSKQQKKELMFEAFQYIERAIECQPPEGIFAVHKWYAILLNYKLEYEGTKQQIKRCLEVRDHLEKAIQLNQSDPTTWHILGIWHFTLADLPTYQRYIAAAVFGTPPVSTYEKALQHFQKAEEIQPRFYSKNTLMLGKTYMKLKDNEKAVSYLGDAAKAVVVTVDDYEAHCEANNLLKKLGFNKNV